MIFDGTYIERNMVIAGSFIQSLVNQHGKHTVSTNGTIWYQQAYRFLKLKQRIHTSYRKGIIERTKQYIKDTRVLMGIFRAERKYAFTSCKELVKSVYKYA